MPLEATDCIDMIVASPEGRLRLVITDSGETRDPDRRLELLKQKTRTYASYVHSGSFASEHPGKAVADCDIVVMSQSRPTEAMQALSLQGVRLIFEQFDPETARAEREKEPAAETGQSNPAKALFKASLKNDLDLMREAVASGAKPNAPDPLGQYPIEFAVHHGNLEMLKFLIAAGAEFPEKTVGGRTLWVSAHASGLAEIEEFLMGQGVKPGFGDRFWAFLLKLKTPRRQPAHDTDG